jgi:hypothetical protein
LGWQHSVKLEENMGDKYKVESDFDDLHGEPAEPIDVEVDFKDTDNPIIRAAMDGEDYQPPEDDKKDKDDGEDGDKFVEDDDEDELEELEDDDKDDDGDADSDDEDEDADEGEEDEDADEDDDETYSKKVQKRIDREREIRLADKAEADRRIAKLERENDLFKAKTQFREEQSEAEAKLRKLRKKKTEALDEGTTSEVVEIDDQILDIKAERKAKELELKQLEESIDDFDDEPATSKTPEAGKKFLAKYPQFHTNESFQKTVLAADKMVAGRGFDKNLDLYYEEMEKILAPQFPEIVKLAKKTTKKDQRKGAAKKKRSAVGGTSKAGASRGSKRSRRGVIRLTKTDQEQMEIFGFDPKDPVHIKNWVDSKGAE